MSIRNDEVCLVGSHVKHIKHMIGRLGTRLGRVGFYNGSVFVTIQEADWYIPLGELEDFSRYDDIKRYPNKKISKSDENA